MAALVCSIGTDAISLLSRPTSRLSSKDYQEVGDALGLTVGLPQATNRLQAQQASRRNGKHTRSSKQIGPEPGTRFESAQQACIRLPRLPNRPAKAPNRPYKALKPARL